MRKSTSLLALLALLLSACSAPPPQPPPALELAPGWKGAAPAGWVRAGDGRRWQEGRWWELFQDQGLSALMPRVEVGNQNLQLAAANYAQAQALAAQARAQLLPTLGLQASAQRSGEPARGSASVGLAASWAPDLWGRLAEAARAQGALVRASEAQLAAARLAAQAGLAQSYLALREADAEIALMDEIIDGYERAQAITDNRYRAGIAAHTDLLQAQNTLASARATRAGLRRVRDLSEHAIALLLGSTPAQFALAPAAWAGVTPQVPPQLPSELLLRRPDVAAAQQQVEAANAQIGVARAAWFPSLNLNAGLGAGAASLAEVWSAPVLAWSLGAALAQAMFDGGARSAAIAQARAAHLGASANYRQAALAAIGQVEDQLATLAALAEQQAHQRVAADAAMGAEERMSNAYRAGTVAYTNVVSAQASSLGARRQLLQLALQRQQAALALVQALGGGWQPSWATP